LEEEKEKMDRNGMRSLQEREKDPGTHRVLKEKNLKVNVIEATGLGARIGKGCHVKRVGEPEKKRRKGRTGKRTAQKGRRKDASFYQANGAKKNSVLWGGVYHGGVSGTESPRIRGGSGSH